jgi:hypothetical protein
VRLIKTDKRKRGVKPVAVKYEDGRPTFLYWEDPEEAPSQATRGQTPARLRARRRARHV